MPVLPTAADYPFRLRLCKAESNAINKRSAAGFVQTRGRRPVFSQKPFLFLISRSGLGVWNSFWFLFANGHPEFYLYFSLDAFENLWFFFQCLLGIFAPLPQAIAFIGKPRTTLINHALRDGQIKNIAFARNTFTVHDVKLAFTERRRHFVLRYLNLGAVAHHPVSILDCPDSPDIQPQGGIELEGPAAGCRFGTAKHHADLFTNLVDEDEAGIRLKNYGRELAKRL